MSLFFCNIVIADIYHLKCKYDDGSGNEKFFIDINKKIIRWSNDTKEKEYDLFEQPGDPTTIRGIKKNNVKVDRLTADIGKKVPKIKINLVSYLGKPRNISILLNENNIVQLDENTFEIFVPIKSFKNFNSVNWTKIKELRFRILETSNFEIVDFKLIEFRGDPDNPTKWFK